MVELERTADPIRVSFLRTVLEAAGIEAVVLDQGLGGLLSAAVPVRVMVPDEDLDLARRAVDEALAQELDAEEPED